MADYAELIFELKDTLKAENSPVIGFGGSYGENRDFVSSARACLHYLFNCIWLLYAPHTTSLLAFTFCLLRPHKLILIMNDLERVF